MPGELQYVDHDQAPWDWFLSIVLTSWGLSRRLRKTMADVLAALELSDDEFLTLALIAEFPQGISQVDLAEKLGISTAQTSGLVDRLKLKACVNSNRDPADRRRQFWQLQETGVAKLAAAMNALQPLLAGLQSSLTAIEAERLPRGLQQLLTSLDNAPSKFQERRVA